MSDKSNTNSFLELILQFPKNILRHAHMDDLPDLLLHKLSGKNLFAFKKAVYCLDNPEFNTVKGISGFCSSEATIEEDGHWWADCEKVVAELRLSEFNQSIKKFRFHSVSSQDKTEQENLLKKIAQEQFGFKEPVVFSWKAKHGNVGLFFCELHDTEILDDRKSFLEFVISLLSMTHF